MAKYFIRQVNNYDVIDAQTLLETPTTVSFSGTSPFDPTDLVAVFMKDRIIGFYKLTEDEARHYE